MTSLQRGLSPKAHLLLNCQGAGADLTKDHLEELHKCFFPRFLFLSETKNNRIFMQDMQMYFGYDHVCTVEPRGLSGGLALFYMDEPSVFITFSDEHLIDIETTLDGHKIFMTFVYGDPVVKNRDSVWERLTRMSIHRKDAWFMIGDFNEITGNHEKRGGRRRPEYSFIPFRTMLDHCGMLDFPYKGNSFSWVGRRRSGKVKCRLDRAVGNGVWQSTFSHTIVEYLRLWGSDHRPVLAMIQVDNRRSNKSFRFDKRWLGKPGFKEAVTSGWGSFDGVSRRDFHQKVANCRKSISTWKKSLPTNSEKMIDALKDQLDAAQDDESTSFEEIEEIRRKLSAALREEEMFWKQKKPDSALRYITEKVTESSNQFLLKEPSEAEIKKALFDINPDKAPGPDGMTCKFYQKFWQEFRHDIVNLVTEFFTSGSFDPRLNQTNICLIPKKDKPRAMVEFRPISLCNVSYKIISKLMCNRLKRVLPNLISETQSAFMARRLITDNILLAQENFHALRTNPVCRESFMAIKTDMSKAYDRVEWSFLEALMIKLGFSERWVKLLMFCISSVSYQVLLNGEPRGKITPSRGLRIGDPLSPFLFILCTEALISLLKGAEEEKRISGLKVAQASPPVSHLLFADDSLFFCKAELQQGAEIFRILNTYGSASGQQLNLGKSSIMFGNRVDPNLKQGIRNAIGITSEGEWVWVTDKLRSAIANFWWSSKPNNGGIHWIAWDKICIPKEMGGLGFRDLQDFNLALLAKQLWRLILYPSSLLARVLRGRYYRQSDPLEDRNVYSPSYGWRSIMAAKPFLKMGLRKTIGLGLNTRVWSEPWIPDTRARPAIAVPIMRYRDPGLLVYSFIRQDTKQWDIHLLRQFFQPEDVSLILGLRPSQTRTLDGYAWNHSKSGLYSVKSGYDLIRRTRLAQEDGTVLEPSITALKRQVWKVRTPGKMKHFMWQTLSGCIATCQNLTYRHLGSDRSCPRCGDPEESINHLLFLCLPALQVWALSDFPSLPGFFLSTSIYQNMSFLLLETKEIGMTDPQKDVYPWILWYIWKARNDKIFKGREISPEYTLIHAKVEAESWRIANQSEEDEEVVQEHFVPLPPLTPTPGVLRTLFCRIDASWIDHGPVSGFGWTLEDGRGGEFFGQQGCPRSLSALHAEMNCLLWAMSCLRERQITSVLFQTDCLDLVSMSESPADWPIFRSELEIFGNLRGSFSEFALSHIPRSQNIRADSLAKGARVRSIIFSHIHHTELVEEVPRSLTPAGHT
ncbi:uncharacterized protein LOC112089817 [Eutrema salsugineum]|uniref:uncharacterized protein LOC112089817 n=1 Tax=Eutrema salsugineum TaxID=72664 RepID=UPI000CED08D8|nr:uncharacterized protein LOC112089817 [Eutrema salsugineum]